MVGRKGWLVLMLAAGLAAARAASVPPTGRFDNGQCVNCHRQATPALVEAWEASAHARREPRADCLACHGDRHAGAAARARRNGTCRQCHPDTDPATRSYATSKHGLILQLETTQWDWTKPLASANYRTPGCAYCHLHAGEHDAGRIVPKASTAQAESLQVVCQDCHAPRYVRRWQVMGERMRELAAMKVREAEALVRQAAARFPPNALAPLRERLAQMRRHARHVALGIGHQSPDDQWWHGQPALDGDLLRIKGLLSELERRRRLSAAMEEDGNR